MALTPGTRLGVYQITAPLGEGGMGQVWRATDTTLGRQVAIKILPDAFAADPERLARFEREAKTLASLNHPHIAAIYGLEESGGVRALVMELVEGEDLSQRIARGATPINEALPIAKQIAEALEAAHEQGIIHRDLKPANIKVRPDGTVKVLDFGLAKAMDPAGSSGTAMQAATITTPAMTQAGVILGTAAYMAPEQARGRPVDKRADIWAFGAVLYEMLTGRRAFEGEDIADVLSRVLQREPDLAALPASTPPAVRALLARCLTKDPRQRLRDIGDARLDLEPSAADPRAAAVAPSTARRGPAYLPWSIAVLTTAAAIALAAWPSDRRPAEAPMMRVDITTPSILSVDQLIDFAVSPDDQFIAFIAGSQVGQVVVRSLASGDSRPLAGTDGAEKPFWSPDSRSVGFFAGGKLKRVELAGGAVTTIVESAAQPFGATWNRDGVIVFGAGFAQPLMRVSAAGGTPTPIGGSPPEGLTMHGYPRFLPDGDRFLFTSYDGLLTLEVKMGTLSSGAVRTIMPVPSINVQVMPPDRLVYLRDGELRAQRIDFAEGTLLGEPETLATGVPRGDGADGAFAVSARGMLAYRADSAPMQLAWFDRSGRMVGSVGGAAERGASAWARVSPDGGRVALDRTVQGNRDVWVLDTARGALVRVTSDPNIDGFPVWSPDGQRLAFESARSGVLNLYVTAASGQGPEERLQESPTNQVPLHWSADGRFLLYETWVAGVDLYALPMTGSTRTPVPIATTPFAERDGTFSPDGRWVAYQTDQSGRPEIVVQPFPDASRGAVQVSVRGGYTPRWSADGRELFFMERDGTLMAADVKAGERGFESSVPRALFRSSALHWFDTFHYDVDKTGRFLMDVGNQAAPPIRLLLNWRPGAAK